MIKTEQEYKRSLSEIVQMKKSINKNPPLENLGVGAFNLGIQDEVKEYENIKAGKIPNYLYSFDNIGLLLIALRIESGLSQSELARKLGVPASQVCRDERNDYHGVSTITINKLLKIYNKKLTIKAI